MSEADEALWCRIKCGRRQWPVVLVHHDSEWLLDAADPGEPLAGACDYARQTIWLDASRSDKSIRETLHHEIHHASLVSQLPSHLLHSKWAADLEEVMIRVVSPTLLRNLPPTFPPFPPEAIAVIRAARRHRRRAA